MPAPLTAPDAPASAAARTRSARRPAWTDFVLAPSAVALRRWALAGVITSALIILTGAAVRLSQSGLGCPDWPACTAHSLGAAGATGDSLIHRWIEFGNRLVTVAIFVVAVGVFVAAWRFRPPTADAAATCSGWPRRSQARSCCRRYSAAWSCSPS